MKFQAQPQFLRHLIIFISIIFVLLLLIGSNTSAAAQTSYTCDPQIYYGIEHCSDDGGQTHFLIVDLSDSHIKFQAVFPINESIGEECNSVNSNGHPNPYSNDVNSNCPYYYPFETVKDMLTRYRNGFRISDDYSDLEAVAIINTDYFGSDGDHGAQGLAVQNGVRLDGVEHNDTDGHGSDAPSLAISPRNHVRIAIPGSEQTITGNLSSRYFNSVGGGPIIVGGSNYGNKACSAAYPGYRCADIGQSAAGLTSDDRLILISAKKDATGIADYLTQNFEVTLALKFDGGGSASIAWVDSSEVVHDYYPDPDPGDPRRVAEGLIIFSEKIPESSDEDENWLDKLSAWFEDIKAKVVKIIQSWITEKTDTAKKAVQDWFDALVQQILDEAVLWLQQNCCTAIILPLGVVFGLRGLGKRKHTE